MDDVLGCSLDPDHPTRHQSTTPGQEMPPTTHHPPPTMPPSTVPSNKHLFPSTVTLSALIGYPPRYQGDFWTDQLTCEPPPAKSYERREALIQVEREVHDPLAPPRKAICSPKGSSHDLRQARTSVQPVSTRNQFRKYSILPTHHPYTTKKDVLPLTTPDIQGCRQAKKTPYDIDLPE